MTKKDVSVPRERSAVVRESSFDGEREVLPLSYSQEWIWLLIDRFQHPAPDPTSVTAYPMPIAVRLKGRLDVAALERALNEILRRHEVLRTTFGVKDGGRVQVVASSLTMQLPIVNLSRLDGTGREQAIERHVAEEARRPFDLTMGPILRACVLRLADDDNVLLLTVHHVASDGWSLGVLGREVTSLYEAFSTGVASPLQELPIQYADYSLWQREWLRGGVMEEQLSYWRKQLDGAPLVLELPTDYPRPPVQSFRGAGSSILLPKSLASSLKELSNRAGATLFMTLLAAFGVLLNRYSGREDILIGTHISGRFRAEFEKLMGIFINNLALRTDLSGDPTFAELLERVRGMVLEAYANQHLPFVELIRHVQTETDLSRSPLVQVFFVFQNATGGNALHLHGLEHTFLKTGVPLATRDLSLVMMERAEGLAAILGYDTALFKHETIERLLKTFEVLLFSVAESPHERLSKLPLFKLTTQV